MSEFRPYPKIPRWNRDIVITEKLDGTNALIWVADTGEIRAGSRNRWITPQNDNFGFAQWVEQHKAELLALPPGYHYGEWWGLGIQREYNTFKRQFSLFNPYTAKPDCCDHVPILYSGKYCQEAIDEVDNLLRIKGSVAAPGFMKPEGYVIYHTAAQQVFKVTLENDAGHKSNEK